MAWGVLVGHEPMPVGRWIGFALIWVALVVLTAGTLRRKSDNQVSGSVDSVAP